VGKWWMVLVFATFLLLILLLIELLLSFCVMAVLCYAMHRNFSNYAQDIVLPYFFTASVQHPGPRQIKQRQRVLAGVWIQL
jgi:hypothetical protein